ncbi:MAG: helix-turn-helix transcriptional regulator [candidate division KSB1 bacterium]|nr:helix-turn-helix transcriptional regulator [candidate division KSB1 bacterium]MDZ7358222.1 helix-turn-helix transcriptional regulator [candidate division KSB1 bacterium]MDZ7399638.1 helix-turn-helix transcriptional regulator [candidate division KSB1 bacterium]
MKNLLRIKRWQAGLKQYELAEMLNCSPPYLSMVENGRVEATEDFKRRAAMALNTTVEDLFPDKARMISMLP